jgi:signal transduction histidine kinase
MTYATAWVPCLAVYALVFLSEGRIHVGQAVVAALMNVVPSAVLGTGVIWASGRLPWRPRHAVRFVAAHASLACLFAWAWFIALMALLTLQAGLRAGEWDFIVFTGAARNWQLLQGAMLYLVIAGIGYTVRTIAELRAQEARIARAELRAVRAEALRTGAELQALRARLNPHFLFNTLHSVSALVRRDTGAAEQALERFAGMLRYVLHAQENEVDDIPLENELAFTRDYLALEQLRLGTRLRLEEEFDPDTLDVPIPAFTLQPLVENAIKHAVAPFARGGTVRLRSWFDGDDLRLEVSDDGPGVDAALLASATGVGLRVVGQRLEVRYAGRAGLEVDTSPGRGFRAQVHVPAGTVAPLVEERRWQSVQ